MKYTIRDLQAWLNAMMTSDPIAVDGERGPVTHRAVADAMLKTSTPQESELMPESGLYRIIWHWTGGRKIPTQDDLKHYNSVHDYKGNVYAGGAKPEDQVNYDWRKGIGVSHTQNSNTGSIGQAVAGMHGAKGWPALSWSQDPITWEGIDSMLELSAQHCKKYGIPVSKWTTLSHAEVEKTLGIKQNSKWDFMVLPGSTRPENSVKIGDILRARMIKKFM